MDGIAVVDELQSDSAASFSRQLLVMIEKVLGRHSLSVGALSSIAVTVGPGSFTGIRIGISTVQGISLSTGIPAYGVSSLEAITRLMPYGRLVPVMDAGNGNAFFAAFESDPRGIKRLTGDAIAPLEEIRKAFREYLFSDQGPGLASSPGIPERPGDKPRSVAGGAAICAAERMRDGVGGETWSLKPTYVLKSAAERNSNYQ